MNDVKNAPRVLMVGPGRNVMGGISTVVNSYFDLKLNERVELRYIASMEDGNKIKKLGVAVKAYLEFRKCLKDFDIVHVHMAAQASFTRKSLFIRLAKKAGKKIIIHQHAADFDDFFFKQSDELKRQQIKEVFAMADRVIVLSEEWADFFGKYVCDEKKISIVHNGVVIPNYEKADYTDQNVLFLGRLGERKGAYDLLKVIPDVLKRIPNARFFFGGDGEVERCKELAEKTGIADNVSFLGWIRDTEKEEYLKKCSTFVLPSYHEGMPMSVLESMSYGLATISTNVGGIPQIIDNGIDGFRIDAGNIEELTASIVRLLTDVELKEAIGYNASNKIRNCFNANVLVNKLVRIYSEISGMEGNSVENK